MIRLYQIVVPVIVVYLLAPYVMNFIHTMHNVSNVLVH